MTLSYRFKTRIFGSLHVIFWVIVTLSRFLNHLIESYSKINETNSGVTHILTFIRYKRVKAYGLHRDEIHFNYFSSTYKFH